MKKIIFILIVILTTSTSYAQYNYQTTRIKKQDTAISIINSVLDGEKMEWFNPINLFTLTLGCELGDYTNIAYKPQLGAGGFHISALGIYYDFGFTSTLMGDSSEIGIWEDSNADYWHIGCTIPISKWFTISPLYGKITNNKVIINGNDWWIDSFSGNICNRSEIVDTKLYTDYGVVLNINFYSEFEGSLYLGAKITKHQKIVTFGVTYNIGKMISRKSNNNIW